MKKVISLLFLFAVMFAGNVALAADHSGSDKHFKPNKEPCHAVFNFTVKADCPAVASLSNDRQASDQSDQVSQVTKGIELKSKIAIVLSYSGNAPLAVPNKSRLVIDRYYTLLKYPGVKRQKLFIYNCSIRQC